MKKMFTIISFALLAMGLAVFAFDAYTSQRYGFHVNEVAGITDDGGPIDWPTGERPTFTLIPLVVYAFGFLSAGAGVYAVRSRVGQGYHGRIYRGTE
jgi:hypothetical protein